MEKMMKKPEVEAVRFDDADVIATSGLGYNRYVTHYDEVKPENVENYTDYDNQGSNYDSVSSGWTFLWGAGADKPRIDTNYSNLTSGDETTPYAWYDDSTNKWTTTGTSWSTYNNSGIWPE